MCEDPDDEDCENAIISWRGATVALSRERVETPTTDVRSDELGTRQPLAEGSGSLLEPLLPSREEARQPVLPGRGRKGTVPGFSVGNVSLEVRRGQVRQGGVGETSGCCLHDMRGHTWLRSAATKNG